MRARSALLALAALCLCSCAASPAPAQQMNSFPAPSLPLNGSELIPATQSGKPVDLTPAEVATTLLTGPHTWTGVQTMPAPTATAGSIVLTPGSAPTTTPVNGSLYSTSAGFYGVAGGVTYGPFGVGGASLLSSNNTWAGTNLFGAGVKVGSVPTLSAVYALGDSLTYGYAPVLAALGVTVDNGGVPGQSPFQIAGRDGALPTFLSPTGSTICDGGGDVVTADNYVPLTNTSVQTGGVAGSLAGHHGTLTLSGSTYTFTCDVTGSTSAGMVAQPFLFVVDQPYRATVTKIVWTGHNTSQQPQQFIGDATDAIIANTPAATQLLILSDTYDTGSTGNFPTGSFGLLRVAQNATKLAHAGPSRYLDTVDNLIAAYNSSFPPDATDHGNGIPPVSLRLVDAKSTTTGSLTNVATSAPIIVSSGTPQNGDVLVILDQTTPANSEEAAITAVSGSGPTYTLTVTRGFGGSTAQAHASGVYAYAVNTIHYGAATSTDAGGSGCIAAGAPYATAYASAGHTCGYDVIAAQINAWLVAHPAPAATPPTMTASSAGDLNATTGVVPASTQSSVGTPANPAGSFSAWHLNLLGTGFCGDGLCFDTEHDTDALYVGRTANPSDSTWLGVFTYGGSHYVVPQNGASVILGNTYNPYYSADLANVSLYASQVYPDTSGGGSVGLVGTPFGAGYFNALTANTSASLSGQSFAAGGVVTPTTAGTGSIGTSGNPEPAGYFNGFYAVDGSTTFVGCYIFSSSYYCTPQNSKSVALGTTSAYFNSADLGRVSFFNYVLNPDTANYGSVGTSSKPFGQAFLNAYIAAGAALTVSGCSNSSVSAGGAAGVFTSGTAGTCAVTVTPAGGSSNATAPHGWNCVFNDETTPADTSSWSQVSGGSTTTCKGSGTTASGDVIHVTLVGY